MSEVRMKIAGLIGEDAVAQLERNGYVVITKKAVAAHYSALAKTVEEESQEPDVGPDGQHAVDIDVCRQAITTWGKDAQMDMVIEEAAELINAIQKYRRDRCDIDHVAEEIADVAIMLEQAKMIVDVPIEPFIHQKVERLRGILDELRRRALSGSDERASA